MQAVLALQIFFDILNDSCSHTENWEIAISNGHQLRHGWILRPKLLDRCRFARLIHGAYLGEAHIQ